MSAELQTALIALVVVVTQVLQGYFLNRSTKKSEDVVTTAVDKQNGRPPAA